MTTINLKDFYYWYTQDQFIDLDHRILNSCVGTFDDFDVVFAQELEDVGQADVEFLCEVAYLLFRHICLLMLVRFSWVDGCGSVGERM